MPASPLPTVTEMFGVKCPLSAPRMEAPRVERERTDGDGPGKGGLGGQNCFGWRKRGRAAFALLRRSSASWIDGRDSMRSSQPTVIACVDSRHSDAAITSRG